MTENSIIRIGNAAGFWGDQGDAPRLLVEQTELDYLTLEYLAELTLSILAHQKSKDDRTGYASDFPATVAGLRQTLVDQPQLKIVTNAGGMNPDACAREVSRVLSAHGLDDARVASVGGDDLMPRLEEFQDSGESFSNMETGQPLSHLGSPVVSANAYMGCGGIVEALQDGARIVVTGRVADASLVVGPAVYEFGWPPHDWRLLGQATVAGHLIECGAQSTGGIDSNWNNQIDLADVGYPIAEMSSDGGVVITKPEGTGGRVTTGTVAEQLIYEIGDPAAYMTPDVVADFSQVTMSQIAPDRVQVSHGGGRAAPDRLKVSLAYYDGYMVSGTIVISGPNAIEKANDAAKIIRHRAERGHKSLDRFAAEILGAGATSGSSTLSAGDAGSAPWEVVLRVAAQDADREALERVARAIAPLVTSGPPGVTGYTGARPRPHRVLAFWPTTIERKRMSAVVKTRSARDWISDA